MINQNFTGGQLTTVLILILLVPRYLCVLLVSMWSVYSSLKFCSELTTLPLLDHLFLILSVFLQFAPTTYLGMLITTTKTKKYLTNLCIIIPIIGSTQLQSSPRPKSRFRARIGGPEV